MPRAVTVTLRRDTNPIFPDRCAFSGLPCGTQTIGFRILYTGRRRTWGEESGYYVRVPCRKRLKLRVNLARSWRFVRTVIVGVVWAGSMSVAAPLLYLTLKGAPVGARVGMALSLAGVMTVCLVALVAWEQTHPPAFDIAVHGDVVDFAFRDHEYARDFAKLNGALTSNSSFWTAMTPWFLRT
jgi:hypothetical protein